MSGYKYDVFLSFRGPDTRLTIADVVYEGLVGAGISVFIDNEELPVGGYIGPEIERAIVDARIYVPIFSKNYASSAWCLQELEHMVKCRKENAEREIVPIFHDVSPSDVRLWTGSYGEALLKHEGRYGEEKVREWREALMEVGNLSGVDARNARVGKLVNDLVRKLSIKLKQRQRVLPDHLVGIDDRVKDMVQLLGCGFLDVRFVVVHGMGGIGKTTLANAIFNDIAPLFDGCSFLSNVRESLRFRGITSLQERLLSDILKRPTVVHNFDIGVNMIRERFRSKSVLVVLDDVSEKEQLMALMGNHTCLGPGSRIIVTTRDRGLFMPEAGMVLQHNDVPLTYYHYKMTEMNPCHAFQLFRKHAFGETQPPDDLETLSSEIVASTGGYPLALEALGSFLQGKGLNIWVETLNRITKVPDWRVHDNLRISYEALNFEAKEIFLDIACFFNGTNSSIVKHMWEACDLYPESGIDTLAHMSLIKIGHDNKIWMHDQLRLLGRDIIRKTAYANGENQSRLWDPEEASRVLHEQGDWQRKSNVELLRLQFPEVLTLISQGFVDLPKLRALDVGGVNFTGDYKNVFRNLRWLSWDRCPADFDASNFSPSNLVVLKLTHSELRDDWPGWHQITKSSKLEVLEVGDCSRITRLPDLSAVSTLKRLIIRNCQSLVEINESIGKLVHLNYLEIDACKSLRELPEEAGCLKALKELIVRGTNLGAVGPFPQSTGNLRSLTMPLMESVGIKKLPPSIGELKDLESLCLSRCAELRKLPDSIGRLVSLIKLNLSSTSITQLPESIGNLQKLKVLRLDSSKMRKIPTAIGMMEKLEEFHAKKCMNLGGDIPRVIGSLSFLKILNLSHTCIRSVPTTINRLSHLQELYLEGCHELKRIPDLPASLIKLYVESCKLKTVPYLSNLSNLVDLIVSDCSEKSLSKPWDADYIQIPNLNWVGKLSKLKKLTLVHKSIIAPPTELASLHGLERLVLSCFDLQSLTQPLPPTLSMLKLINVNSLPELSPFSDLKYLSSLELCKSWLTNIPLNRFGQPKNLTELTVSNCELLARVSGLSGLKKIRVLRLLNCPRLVEIQGLVELESLESIMINQCNSLARLPNLTKLTKLRTMEFRFCKSLVSFPFLSPEAYKDCHLVVDGCDELANHNGPCRLHKYKRQCRNPRSRL